MANWRETGFVPDSDEDEDESQEERRRIEVVVPGPTRRAEPSCNDRSSPARPSASSLTVPPSSEGVRHEIHDTPTVDGTENPPKPTQRSPLAKISSKDDASSPIRLPASSFILGTAPSPFVPRPQVVVTQKGQDSGNVAAEEHGFQASHLPLVAEELGEELRRGLEVCRDVLRPLATPESLQSDSPLSSPPSTPPRPPSSSSAQPPPAIPNYPSSVQRSSPAQPSGVDELLAHGGELSPDIRSESVTRHVRTFRQRAPLQLHPYSLEAAKYQQDWKQRGLRPIKAPSGPESQRQNAANSNDESQGAVFTSSLSANEHDQSLGQIWTPAEEESQSPRPRQRMTPNPAPVLEEDELDWQIGDEIPDLEDIFNLKSARTRKAESKHISSAALGDALNVERMVNDGSASTRPATRDLLPASIFDLQMSPPRLHSDSPPPDADMASSQEVAGPKQPLTPGRSSETRTYKRPIVDVSSSSDDADDDEHDRLGRPQAESVRPQAFQHMRKRIKGVLPASWVKLDARRQKPPVERIVTARSPEHRPVKGVARHISPRTNVPDYQDQRRFTYSSESESSDGTQQENVPPHKKRDEPQALFDQDNDVAMDDVMEEDSIDRMAPSGPRRISTKPRKKRQQGLGDTWTLPQTKSSAFRSTSNGKRHRKAVQSLRPKNKRQKRPKHPQLSILDAPGLARLNPKEQPTYLRVAARSAMRTRVPREQNPKVKNFNLDTLQDTEEINSRLRDWQEGRLQSRDSQDDQERRFPANNRGQVGSAGQTHSGSTAVITTGRRYATNRAALLDSLKASTKSTLAQLRTRTTAATEPGSQSGLVGLDAPPPGLKPGFVSWRYNRAGGGAFWNHSRSSRPAQLETPAQPKHLQKRLQGRGHSLESSLDADSIVQADADTTAQYTRRSKRPKKQKDPQFRSGAPLPTEPDGVVSFENGNTQLIPSGFEDKAKDSLVGLEVMASNVQSLVDSINSTNDEPLADGTLWKTFGPAFKNFLEAISAATSIPAQACSAGIRMMEKCLWLTHATAWPVPDALLQLLFRQYGKNEMLELFVQPNVAEGVQRIATEHSQNSDVLKLTDFEIFLRLVTVALEQKSNTVSSSNNGRNKVLGLVFSLMPNNSRAMSEHEEIENAHFMTMANTYALYTRLYDSAPYDARPRLSQVENLVNFATSHAQIRDLAIAAWSAMSSAAIRKGATNDDHQALGEQGRAMWSALMEKITFAIRSEVTTSDSTFHHELVLSNCTPVLVQLGTIIKQWTLLTSYSSSVEAIEPYIQARQIDDVSQLLQLMTEYQEKLLSSSVRAHQALLNIWRTQCLDLAVLDLLRSICFRRMPSLQEACCRSARNIMSLMLSAREEEDTRLQKMVDIWFSFATFDSDGDFKKWDRYLEPTSSYSFRMLADTPISQQCAVLFLSKVVAHAPEYFELDLEALYETWIMAMLQAESQLRFEHVLTEQILRFVAAALPLDALQILVKSEASNTYHLSLSLFKHLRTEIVRHVVRAIFGLQFAGPDDSQDLVEELLDQASGRRLLQVISDTLKRVWLNLSSQEQNARYTDFVRIIIQEMQVYQYRGFSIDAWFTDPKRSSFAVVGNRFQQLFERKPGSDGRSLDEAFIAAFRRDNARAANTQDQAAWIRDMVCALSCNDVFEALYPDGSTRMDGLLQIEFMRDVLSVYVRSSFSKGARNAVWTVPVIQILVEVVHDMHFRQDLDVPGRVDAISYLCLELLDSSSRALSTLARSNLPRRKHLVMFAVRLIELASFSIDRLHQFRRAYPDSECLQSLLLPASEIAEAILRGVTDPDFVTQPFRQHGETEPTDPIAPVIDSDLSCAVIGTGRTSFDTRSTTMKDLDDALHRGRLPPGMSSDWSAWYGGNDQSCLGWEHGLSKGEVSALAQAVKGLCVVVARATEVPVDHEWRVWEDLAEPGFSINPVDDVDIEAVAEDDIVEEW